jgi:hypothetical protein
VRAAATGSAGPVVTLNRPDPAPANREPPAAAVHTLAATLVRSSELAAVLRSGRLRPAAATRAAWAVLVVADADPALLSRPAVAVLDVVADLLSPAGTVPAPATPVPLVKPASSVVTGQSSSGRHARQAPAATAASATAIGATGAVAGATAGATGHRQPGDPPGVSPAVRHVSAAPATDQRAGDPAVALPEAAEPTPVWPTTWAGLPFLLAVAADAGIPAMIVDDPVLAARPLRWALHAIACTLVPAAHDDPAVLALAGLGPAGRPPSAQGDPADAAERARIDDVARQWAAALAARLPRRADADAPGRLADADGGDIVAKLARRTGHIVADPGWIDIHLRLDEVDVDVRRAGLDLDPGWVPWLGTVVRFRYA